MLLSVVLFTFPIYWMFASATNSTGEIVVGKLTLGTHLSENFENLTAAKNIGRAMYNSMRNTLLSAFLSLLVSSIAGYGFEVYHDRWKDRLMNIILLSMLIPGISTTIPLYKMIASWKLLNTWMGFVLPGIASVFLIMLFRQSARSFPMEIIEAARIDGLSEFKIFLTMFMPTMKSTYAAALTVTFMNAWNNYLWPKVIMTSETAQTMPMLVANLSVGYSIDYGVLMLGVLICSLPTGILFLVLQKSFANGIVGAVKG